MVWIESPTNPLLQLADLRAIADIVEPYRARGTFMVVDNTFMSAYFQRPLSLGADVVFASCTKYRMLFWGGRRVAMRSPTRELTLGFMCILHPAQ